MAEESSGRTEVPLPEFVSKQPNTIVVCAEENGAKAAASGCGDDGKASNDADERNANAEVARNTDPEGDEDGDEDDNKGQEEEEEELPFPGFVPKAFYCLKQTSLPRYWCLMLITWPYPFADRVCMCVCVCVF
ncbi:hypothetical protein NP493_342g01022 [Ridgeia piscesae]|uniref:Uncharacterized protein n=1 Tax=Ridgeia piscesae TaxID=27915 RepID=A0AAD9L4U0_RIDPI|nr:hypothetical protein NP493_342g01022 [Ridgeia piscesae]